MGVGFAVNKIDIDSTLGQVSVQLRDSISRVPILYATVSAMTDAELETLGYAATDLPLLKAALADLQQIHDVAFGVAAQATAYDFRQNISKVTGLA